MADKFLDCKNTRCPGPLIEISKSMKLLAVGQTIEVEATDGAFCSDVKAWVKKLGYQLIEITDEEVKRAVIKKV